MKKILLVLAVLILATPAFAGVTVAVVPIPDTNTLNLTYTLTGAELTMGVRAFALSLTVTAGDANIIGCDPNMTGESTNAVPGFGIFIGSIVIDAQGDVSNYGDPVAQADDPDDPGQLGTQSIIVEFGSLYDNDANPTAAPAATGTLALITLDACGSTVTPAVDSLRGGIVMEDPDTAATGVVMTPGACAAGDPDCFQDSMTIGGLATNPTQVTLWGTLGKPDCWCCPRHARGDATGDGFTNINDVTAVLNNYQTVATSGTACVDNTRDGFININDITTILNNYQTGAGTACPPLP